MAIREHSNDRHILATDLPGDLARQVYRLAQRGKLKPSQVLRQLVREALKHRAKRATPARADA